MGNGERNNDASMEAAVDGWFDLLDEELEQEAASRPTPPARPSMSPVNLSGLNEISNKVTPVMLAPVNHLLPIEPSVAPEPARDAWDDDLAHDPLGGALLAEPAANGIHSPSAESLPPLSEGEDEHGQEFLEFGEAPGVVLPYGALPLPPAPEAPPTPVPLGLLVTPFGAEAADSLPPPRESSRSSHPPPTGRLSHLRRSKPPSAVSMPSMPPPSSPPRTPTLLGQSLSVPPPPPAASFAAPDEESFDLSDFDRWGEETPRPSTSVQNMFVDVPEATARAPVPVPVPVPAPVHALFTDGSEFASPPEHESFSEALTVPLLGPHIPAVSVPAVRSSPPPQIHTTPTRPSVAPPSGAPRRSSATMAWAEAPTPALGIPSPPQGSPPPALPPRRPPPLPRAESIARAPSSPTAARQVPAPARQAPASIPRATPDPPPPRRISPRQEMHERLDVGDFTAALATAETMLEVDPDDQDAMHVAEVCRAKLKAIYIGRLGSLDKIPVLAVQRTNLRGLSLDHRSGFLLSMIDGMSSIEEIIDIAAMPPLEALRTLYNLVTQQIITLRDR